MPIYYDQVIATLTHSFQTLIPFIRFTSKLHELSDVFKEYQKETSQSFSFLEKKASYCQCLQRFEILKFLSPMNVGLNRFGLRFAFPSLLTNYLIACRNYDEPSIMQKCKTSGHYLFFLKSTYLSQICFFSANFIMQGIYCSKVRKQNFV